MSVMPPSYQQLIYLLIGKIEEPIRTWDEPTPVFVPVFSHYAKAWMRLKPYLEEAHYTVFCNDREMRTEFQTSRPNITVFSFDLLTEETKPCPGGVLVVATPDVDATQLLLSISLARHSLTIAFIHDQPHPLFHKIKPTVSQLLEPNAQFVSWETRRFKKRKLSSATTYDWYKGTRDVPTVKELVHHLVKAIPPETKTGILNVAAHMLGWRVSPKLYNTVIGNVNLVPPHLDNTWRIIAGNAVEHLVDHAICQVHHPTRSHGIVLPPLHALEYLSAIMCSDACIRDVINKSYATRNMVMNQEGWTHYFEDHHIPMSSERQRIISLLHQRPSPHFLVDPAAFTPELRALVKYAVDVRADTYNGTPDERAWWVLGALDYLIHHNDANPLILLGQDKHFSPSAKIPDMFQRALRQLRTILNRLSAQSLVNQVKVVSKGRYTGKADFVINKNTVLELKFSPNDTHNLEWVLQAAIYCHTLGLKRFIVVNLGTGTWSEYWLCQMDEL